ncbi:MAG: DUF2500 family protein [Acutalibacteraceae bacterium]
MSINDVLMKKIPDEVGIIALIIFIGAFIVIPFAIYFTIRKEREIYGENSDGEIQMQNNVKVLSKSNFPHPRNPKYKINIIIFELENKERLEFAIKDNIAYEKILIGDIGNLRFRGKQFISFECN